MLRHFVFFLLAAAPLALATPDNSDAVAANPPATEEVQADAVPGLHDEAIGGRAAAPAAAWSATKATETRASRKTRRRYAQIGAASIAFLLGAFYFVLGSWIGRKVRDLNRPRVEIQQPAPVLTGPGHASGPRPTPSA